MSSKTEISIEFGGGPGRGVGGSPMPRPRRAGRTLVAGLLLALAGCGDDDDGPKVLSADDGVGDDDPTALLQQWSTALIETPLDDSWLADLTRCDNGISSEDVYFAPTFAAPGEASVDCTMTAGQTLFLSPVGVFCVTGDGDTADDACVEEQWNLTSSEVSIDGEAVEGLDDRTHRTEVFGVTLPEGNIFDTAAVATDAIVQAQVVLVEGLDAGDHTVVLGGDFGDGEFAGRLTINLTVEE